MKVTKNELVDVVKEAIEDGWFSEVTEEVLNDEIEMGHLIRAFVRTYKLPAIISNCCNNYGPNQFPEKLIPKLIHNII